ncbi:hypothetical protein NW768_008480 [Fusarium equiseti]|uniref:Uncharacterized protein n=1 Tax=Fusarium equiseti TaxID=61235 RepID=A0ABQ8R7M9_FUSEQ|nr:hypothetical protein NW768_008480 [Fusarium equiseti]
MALTFAALEGHNAQLAAMTASPPFPPIQVDDDASSECSYYSLADLENDRWYRNIPASQLREQASQVPTYTGALYPRQFYNQEKLELVSDGPLTEYPFCLNKRYIYGSPGPVRIILNLANPAAFDVVYHPDRLQRKVCQAVYRPRGYKKGACLKPSPYNPLPADSMPFSCMQPLAYQAPTTYWYPPVQPLYSGLMPTYNPAMVIPVLAGFPSLMQFRV